MATTNRNKAIGLDWQKNNFACASCFFVYFLAIVSRLQHETSETQHTNFLFLSLNLDMVLSDLTQKILPTFDKLNEIK